MTRQAWLNGVFIAAEEARISPFDRGFLFADGVYEVSAVYNGQLIDMERHLDRLERSLRELKFGTMPDRKELEDVHRKLVELNGIDEGYVYLQVTRGAYGARDFIAPDVPRLTTFLFAEKRALIDTPAARNGSKIVALPDIRWARRDIKSVGLLAQPAVDGRQQLVGIHQQQQALAPVGQMAHDIGVRRKRERLAQGGKKEVGRGFDVAAVELNTLDAYLMGNVAVFAQESGLADAARPKDTED